MMDSVISFFRELLFFFPFGEKMVSTGGAVVLSVFILNIGIVLCMFAERKSDFHLRFLWHDTWGKLFLFFVLGTLFLHGSLILITAGISLRNSLPPVGFTDYGNGNIFGIFLDAQGKETAYPMIGEMTGEFFMELVSPAQKKVLYSGFLFNTLLANIGFYLFAARYVLISFRKRKR